MLRQCESAERLAYGIGSAFYSVHNLVETVYQNCLQQPVGKSLTL